MSIQSINFANQEFQPQPCGGLYWPSKNILIVSDLHFEKSSHFAMKGQFLPPYDSLATLQKLNNLCEKLNPQHLIFLGDVFHDRYGYDRLNEQAKNIFDLILSRQKMIWIDGNHDKGFAPDNIQTLDEIAIAGISFTHIATNTDFPEISGHYHPCTSLKHKGHKIRRPCFIYNHKKMIMPAFGALTGDLDCSFTDIQNLIPNPSYVLTGGDKVLIIKH